MRLLTLALALLVTAAATAQTYGERLGWGPQDRVLIIHSDDLGMSLASNQGTIQGLEFGTISSCSMMMPTPWVVGFNAYLKEHPQVDVGLHLTMTSEFDYYRWVPLAGKNQVPGLTDKDGCLPDGAKEVYANATPDEVEKEIRAQLDRALSMGIKPTHTDSHMGILFRNGPIFERWLKVTLETKIPMLMMGSHPAAKQVWDAGLPVIDYLHTDSYDWKTTDKSALYIDAFKNLKPGITEMIIHATKPNDVIGVITGGRDHLYGDYNAMIDPKVKQALADEKIILTNWRELQERRNKAGK